MRRLLALITLALLPARAEASGVDVTRWLDRPGVRMLAVEFYATWCKPCMAAVPRWKALHEKHAQNGLRLIVVATRDPKAGCANPGWSPDEVVCDDDGSLATMFGADDALPAAFLWSWDGKLLVRRGDVDAVEKAVEAWMLRAPRVAVSAEADKTSGVEGEALLALVRARLQDSGKLAVVATAEEKKALDQLKLESMKARYDDRAQCELGKELPANVLLRANAGGAKPKLALSLFSAEQGCLIASTVIDWRAKDASAIVAEGVSEVLQRLRSDVAAPREGAKAQPPPVAAVDRAPKIQIESTGLDAANIEAEKLLEAAQDVQADANAKPEARRDAWCKLSQLPAKKNPYRADATKACGEWKRFVEDQKKLLARLAGEYDTMIDLLSLKSRSDDDKRAALDNFIAAYASAKDERIAKLTRLRAMWPMKAAEVRAFLDRKPPLEAAWKSMFNTAPEVRGAFPKSRTTVVELDSGHQTQETTWMFRADGLPETEHNGPPNNVTTRFVYDAAGYLVGRDVESSGSKYRYVYELDGAGRVVRSTHRQEGHPDTVSTLTYDEKGRLIAETSPTSSWTNTYESDDRWTLRAQSSGSTPTVCTYERTPGMLKYTCATQTITWRFDTLGRPSEEVQTSTYQGRTYTTTHRYLY